MRDYEMMVVLSPELGDEEGRGAVMQRIQDVITNVGGEVKDVDEWGLRRLAYEIDDHRDGYYSVTHFQGDPTKVDEIERALRLMEPILRFIVVRMDEE